MTPCVVVIMKGVDDDDGGGDGDENEGDNDGDEVEEDGDHGVCRRTGLQYLNSRDSSKR